MEAEDGTVIDHKGRETEVEVVDDDGTTLEIFDWPFCGVDGCENRICLNISERYCHPHSGGTAVELLKTMFNKETVN